MAAGRYRFDRFSLDPIERRLFAGEVLVELNSRYFDALLLLKHPGMLLSKERFLQEVWQGIPVTDEVLTQCIKTLRRQLGDSATRPHLIETVPKHGYRFIARVSWWTPTPHLKMRALPSHHWRWRFPALTTGASAG